MRSSRFKSGLVVLPTLLAMSGILGGGTAQAHKIDGLKFRLVWGLDTSAPQSTLIGDWELTDTVKGTNRFWCGLVLHDGAHLAIAKSKVAISTDGTTPQVGRYRLSYDKAPGWHVADHVHVSHCHADKQFPMPSRTTVPSPNAGPRPFLTLMCHFRDDPYPRDASYFEDLLGSQYPGIDHFLREVSYGLVNLQGSRVNAEWIELPETSAFYSQGFDRHGAARDACLERADESISFDGYYGITLMFSNVMQARADRRLHFLDGSRSGRLYSIVYLGAGDQGGYSFNDQRAPAHEFLHAVGGWPHSAADAQGSLGTKWDALSFGGVCGGPDAVFGCISSHPIGYQKDNLQWLPPGEVLVDDGVGTATFDLRPLSSGAIGDGYLVAKIPIPGTSTRYYSLETRRRLGYDFAIPLEGVVIHAIDTVPVLDFMGFDRHIPAVIVDGDGNGDPDDGGAAWLPGEVFESPEGIRISIGTENEAGTYSVTVAYP